MPPYGPRARGRARRTAKVRSELSRVGAEAVAALMTAEEAEEAEEEEGEAECFNPRTNAGA